MKKTVFFMGLAGALALAFVGCSKSDMSDRMAGPMSVPGEDAGFDEFPIGDDIEVGPLNVAGVYFQPVDMLPAGMGLTAAESDIHLEADISALENDLGYGVGDFVPYLTVEYEIINNANMVIAASGTFMLMNASDGPHYGGNIALPQAGSYTVRFIIHSPEENGFVLHVDELTGVPGRFSDYWGNGPLVAEWDDFQYAGSLRGQ